MKYAFSVPVLILAIITLESCAVVKGNIVENIQLGINESGQVFKELKLTVTDVTFEEIEADPEDSVSTPAGSGVNVSLTATSGDNQEKLVLSRLSPPYDSVSSVDWNGFKIRLLAVSEDNNPVVELSITKAE